MIRIAKRNDRPKAVSLSSGWLPIKSRAEIADSAIPSGDFERLLQPRYINSARTAVNYGASMDVM
jgi:hypothetical protein